MFDLPEVASRSTTAILYIYIYIFVRPSANENPPPSSRFDASILSNGVEEEEKEEEEEVHGVKQLLNACKLFTGI